MPIARVAFEAEYDGALISIKAGEIVAEGHELLRRFPHSFSADPQVFVAAPPAGTRMGVGRRGTRRGLAPAARRPADLATACVQMIGSCRSCAPTQRQRFG